MKDVSFYGLLHIDPRKLAQFNAGMDTNDRFLAYVQNAIVSARSLKHFGHSYRLVTNAPEGVARRLATACHGYRLGLA